jgi:hypothetical protein
MSYFISPHVWSDRGKAAVHHHGRAGEVARLRRREENDRLVWRSVANHPLECLNVGFDLPRQPIHEHERNNSPDT